MQPRQQPGSAHARVMVVALQCAERRAGRIVRRQRRAQALHPAALLVDEDRRVGAADAVAHCGDQVADLLGLADVAGKQDEAPRPFAAVEADFLRG